MASGLSINRCAHSKNQFDERKQDWLVPKFRRAWLDSGRAFFFLLKINPFNPSIKIQILICYPYSKENLLKYQVNSSCVIMSSILMTTVFYKAVILHGEIWCLSLLGGSACRVKLLMLINFKTRLNTCVDQMFIPLSKDPEAIYLPSGLNASEYTGSWCLARDKTQLPRSSSHSFTVVS